VRWVLYGCINPGEAWTAPTWWSNGEREETVRLDKGTLLSVTRLLDSLSRVALEKTRLAVALFLQGANLVTRAKMQT